MKSVNQSPEFLKSLKKNIIRLIVCILFPTTLPAVLFSQRPAQFIRMGEEAEATGKIAEAFSLYEQAYELDTTNFEATLHYAKGALLSKDYLLAEKLFTKVYSKDSGKLFSEGLFWVAMMQKHNGHYEEAMRNFKKYAKKHKKKGEYTYEKSLREIESCTWAINYKSVSDSLIFHPLEENVNTAESENAAFLFGDRFYFSTYRNDGEREAWSMMSATWDGSAAKDPAVINIPNLGDNMANLSFGQNDEVYFTYCPKNGLCSIWKAMLKEGSLFSAEQVAGLNAPSANTTMPCFTVIQGFSYLFFSSDRAGGEGGMDIWYSREKNGEWSEPINAGNTINSRDDELTPFYSTGHLYFSSSWHNGFGGQDVFRVAGIPGNWTDPVNMGPPVNSNKNDFFFSVFPEKEKVFLSSNREGAAIGDGYSTCCNDIYVADLPSKIIEEEKKEEYKNLAELNRFLPVRLYFHNDEPNPRSLDTTTLVKYSEAYDSYKKLFDSYVKENAKGLSGSEKEDAEYDVEDFFSLTVDKGMSDLSLFFDLLLKELKQGQSIRLSIRGFASPRAKSDYNEKLTMRRIASLVNEMKSVQNGIFLPYINGTATDGGHLEFEALPFGEYKADKTVSDDLFNEKQSIYSRGARLERKIEIESVKIVSPIKKPVLKLEEESFDFGPIPKSGVVHHTFYISNEGNALMVIDSVIASCGCLVPILEKDTVLPSERIALEVGFIPFDKNGKETKEITIYIAGEPPKVITISADVQH